MHGSSTKYRIGPVRLACVILLVLFVSALVGEITAPSRIAPVSALMMLPFILLLLSIAVIPFVSARWWERNYPWVSSGLAAIAVIYYIFFLGNGRRMAQSGSEYYSFMALIASLFIVSGGIHIRIKGRSTPLANTIILGVGAVMANLLGTTGASMVLIRPYIRTNKYRISGYHIVFFIFIVSNIGGLLTPIGPPLFLGYLKGVPFFWVMTRTWPIWLISTGILLLVFYVMDTYNFKKIPDRIEQEVRGEGEQASIEGLFNAIFLGMILGAVFLSSPFREMVMLCSATVSLFFTARDIHRKNEFNFTPLKEVAILFAGIFATMTPVMDWLELNAGTLGITRPGQFYWGSGILSSFLDNAPTYLNFLSMASGLHGLDVSKTEHIRALLGLVSPHGLSAISPNAPVPISPGSWKYVLAISAGSVMFGAGTYIGNGPNFMVKSIAEQAHVRMPSYFGYVAAYSIPILFPIFLLIWYLFFS